MTSSLAQRISVAAHRDLPHANPLSVAQFDALVRSVAERRPREALDVGCGFGSFAIALARACDARVLGVDINAGFLARGRCLAADVPRVGEVEFREVSAGELEDRRYDAVACMGSSQAFGTPVEGLARCASMLRADGTLLFAEGVWEAEPPREFLDFLGLEDASMFWRREEAVDVFARAGLAIVHEEVTSRASWVAYEDAIHAGRMRFADELAPTHPDEAAEVRDRAERWTAAWQRWGRHCLGFVGYVAIRT